MSRPTGEKGLFVELETETSGYRVGAAVGNVGLRRSRLADRPERRAGHCPAHSQAGARAAHLRPQPLSSGAGVLLAVARRGRYQRSDQAAMERGRRQGGPDRRHRHGRPDLLAGFDAEQRRRDPGQFFARRVGTEHANPVSAQRGLVADRVSQCKAYRARRSGEPAAARAGQVRGPFAGGAVGAVRLRADLFASGPRLARRFR